MSTPQQRVHDATRELLGLLETGDSTSARALAIRADLAVATAEAGQHEDAFFQADELVKDALREHGPDAEEVAGAREAAARVEQIVRAALGAGGEEPADDPA